MSYLNNSMSLKYNDNHIISKSTGISENDVVKIRCEYMDSIPPEGTEMVYNTEKSVVYVDHGGFITIVPKVRCDVCDAVMDKSNTPDKWDSERSDVICLDCLYITCRVCGYRIEPGEEICRECLEDEEEEAGES